VRSAGNHRIGIAAANDLGRLANRLTAGRTGRQAVHVRALGVEQAGDMPGRHAWLLLQLGHRREHLQTGLDESRQIKLRAVQGADHHLAEPQEILIALAAAQVDAQTPGIQAGIKDPGGRDGLFRRSDGKFGVPST